MRPALLYPVPSHASVLRVRLIPSPFPASGSHTPLPSPAQILHPSHMSSLTSSSSPHWWFSSAHHNFVPTLTRATLSPTRPINLASANRQERSNVFPTPPALFSS